MRRLAMLMTIVALAGCSSSSQPTATSSPASNSTSSPATSPAPTACPFDTTVAGVTATRQPGGNPTITIAATAQPPKKLVVEDLCTGTGTAARVGDVVVTDYALAPYSTRKQLESSFERGQPLALPLIAGTGTIQGFLTGIEGMRPGGARLLLVPGSLAYGKTPPAGSPFEPNESFAFVVQLDAVNPGVPTGP